MRPLSALARSLCLSAALVPLVAAWPSQAGSRDYYFRSLGREVGLRQNSVNAIVQDRQGFVWVATQGGLHRFDGQRYVSFRHDPRDAATLPDSFVTALAVGDDDSLWIGTGSQYVARLDLRSGHMRRMAATSAMGAAERQVLAVLPQGAGVWVGTRAGLQWLDPATGTRRTVLRLESTPPRQAPTQVLLGDAGRGVWYATPSGLFHVTAAGRATRVGPAEPVRSLHRGPEGTLWVGRLDGLHRLRAGSTTLERAWPAAAVEDRQLDIRAIARAPDGRLWLSVLGQGLVRFDPATGAARELQRSSVIGAGLPEDAISTLLVDRGGMLWVGGQLRGVAVADTRGTRFSYLVDAAGELPEPSRPDESVRALARDDDGALWIATDSSQLLRYDTALDRFEDRAALLPRWGTSRHAVRITAFADAGDRRFWAATDRGLHRFDTRAGRLVPVPMGAFGDIPMRSLLVDRRGDLWIGTTGHGTLHYRTADGHVTRYGQRDDAAPQAYATVHALLEDRRGRIWMGTSDGLDLLDRATGTLRHFRHVADDATSLPGNLVRALHESANGAIWVGTHAGLSRIREHAGPDTAAISFTQPLAESLGDAPVPLVYSLAERPAGTLWLGTDHGIVRYDTASRRSRTYLLEDGLQDLEFNGGAVAYLDGGRLAFGGVRGVNVFDPARMREPGHVAPVRLLSARIGADASGDGGTLWQPVRLDIPDAADLLRLRIGALDFAPAARPRYRYRMDGFDPDWIENGESPDITYTRLPPGDYVFRAQASHRDGTWNPVELRVPVHVEPPAWRHPAALAAAAFALLALAAALAWRMRQRRLLELGWFAQIREREERLKLALWASGEQFWDYDLVDRTLHRMRVDDQAGPTPDIGVQSAVEADHEIHPDDQARVLEELRRHLRGDAALFLSEHRIRGPGGRWVWVRARGRVVERDANGRALRVAGTARDISASRSAERERRISSEVLRSMTEAVAVFDRDFVFVAVNPAFTRMTGYSDTEVIGRPTRVLDSAQHDPDLYHQVRAELERNGHWSGELWQQRKDGSEFLCCLQASAVEDAAEQREHYVAVLTDVTEQKKAEQELRYLANYDTLTSLPNRTLLSERLSRAIVRARRHHTKIALLFLDLDRFKDINDSLGHAAGDRILRAAASRLQQTVGPQHTVARLGGDEFTVVLEHITTPEEAEQVARDIIEAFGAPLDFDERHDLAISPSIGIALYPDHAQVPTDLLKHADTAMYQAKAVGRRTFMRYHEGMDIEVRRRATLSAALRKVIARGELHVVYQPRLALPRQRITGVEALLRWHSPEHGDVPPSQFIPLAEESGMILEIGEWVLRQACMQLRRWRDAGLTDITMAVNVSALQLLRGDLTALVARVLADTGVPANRLELELTETVLMTNAQATADTLQGFSELGVGLAIDDFGTGYSSLSYLKRLPITTIKIDKAFIDDLTHDPDDEAITTTVITMAHSLDLTVVAEGVETADQMRFLHEHGCDEVQGYWLSRPLDAERCAAFIHAWTPLPDATVAP